MPTSVGHQFHLIVEESFVDGVPVDGMIHRPAYQHVGVGVVGVAFVLEVLAADGDPNHKSRQRALRKGVSRVDDLALQFPWNLGYVGFSAAEHGNARQVLFGEEESERFEIRGDAPVFVWNPFVLQFGALLITYVLPWAGSYRMFRIHRLSMLLPIVQTVDYRIGGGVRCKERDPQLRSVQPQNHLAIAHLFHRVSFP